MLVCANIYAHVSAHVYAQDEFDGSWRSTDEDVTKLLEETRGSGKPRCAYSLETARSVPFAAA